MDDVVRCQCVAENVRQSQTRKPVTNANNAIAASEAGTSPEVQAPATAHRFWPRRERADATAGREPSSTRRLNPRAVVWSGSAKPSRSSWEGKPIYVHPAARHAVATSGFCPSMIVRIGMREHAQTGSIFLNSDNSVTRSTASAPYKVSSILPESVTWVA